jgi:predicted CopG family antitoxin
VNLNENISRVKELMGLITEVRKGWYELLKQKLPHFPEYVLKDWIYRKVDNYKDYESFLNWIDEFLVDIEWEYEKNFPITMDIFGDKTKKELEERISGLIRTDVENDIIRH